MFEGLSSVFSDEEMSQLMSIAPYFDPKNTAVVADQMRQKLSPELFARLTDGLVFVANVIDDLLEHLCENDENSEPFAEVIAE